MPPSPIARSISAPDILPSDQSSGSSATAKETWWSKKTLNLLTKKNKSDLTEESLEALNKRNEALDDKKLTSSSPYYKGLTDFTLDINREKHPSAVQFPPVLDNHEAVSITSSTRSSFIVTMQQLGTFCLFFRNKEQKDDSSSASSSSTRPQKEIDSGDKAVKSSFLDSNISNLLNKEKPLRERVLSINHEPTSSQPQPSQISPPQNVAPRETSVLPETLLSKKDALDEKLNDIKEDTKLFTWADKYRPQSLTEFICNKETAVELKTMAKSPDCSHFIFEGLPGVGKRTMILALLREMFSAKEVEARQECMEFYFKGEAVSSIKVNVKRSSHHVELNLSELKGYEKHVIVKLIKEKYNDLSNNVSESGSRNYQAIILYEADKLSTDAQLYIKWILERYKGSNKVFFCCNDISKVQPIKMLCRVVKLLPPSNKEIMEVLEFIAKQEEIELADKLTEDITNSSKNNLRQAIRSFEATWRYNNCSSKLKEDHEIMTGWEEAIAKVANDIVHEQSPRQLYIIRGELQKLIEYNVSPVFIFRTLIGEIKKHLDESLQIHVDIMYKEYNKDKDRRESFANFPHNRTEEMCKRQNDPSRKNVHHFMKIEEFIAKFMSWYKSLLANNKLQDMEKKEYIMIF